MIPSYNMDLLLRIYFDRNKPRIKNSKTEYLHFSVEVLTGASDN